MKLLTSLAVACAAGTISFAASAQPQAPIKKVYLFSSASAPAKPEQAKPAKAKRETGKKKTVRKGAEKAKATKATIHKKRSKRTKNKRQRIVIDTTTTAAIAVAYPGPVTAGTRYEGFVAQYASSNGVPVSLAHAVISVESNYRVDALGSAGEIGLMQIKPATARMMGYRGSVKGLYDPETNIKYGMKYLGMAHKLGGGATCSTILKYNAGHAARRMNPVSSAYCGKVMSQIGG